MVQQVIEMRKHMRMVAELVKTNMGWVQDAQRKQYDKRVQPREFKLGQKVLILLPAENAMLFAKWQGPYTVTQRVGPVDYQMDMHDKRKRLRVFHVNLLRLWNKREELYTEAKEGELGPEVPQGVGEKGLEIAQWLTPEQVQHVEALQREYQGVFSKEPGCTSLAEHWVETLPVVVVRSSVGVGRKT